jgi:hypothetical protein
MTSKTVMPQTFEDIKKWLAGIVGDVINRIEQIKYYG